MLLSKLFQFREYSGNFVSSKRTGLLPPDCLDNLVCQRQDEFLIEGQEYGTLIPPLACSFSKVNPQLLAVSDEDGALMFYNTRTPGTRAYLHEFLAHNNAVFDLDWMPGENKLLSASGDQSTILWDVGTEDKVAVFKGHSSSIKSVRWRNQDPYVFATGARDGHIMVYDRRTKEKGGHIGPVNAIRNAHASTSSGTPGKQRKRASTQKPADSQQSVTSVLFQDDVTLISAGSTDAVVKVWDLRKTYSTLKKEPIPRDSFSPPQLSNRKSGYSHLLLDSTRTRLFASSMNNKIYQFDCASFRSQPVTSYQGHKNATFYIRTSLSPDDLYLLSGSSDNNAYIWKVDDPQRRPLVLEGHAGEVSSVAWHPSDLFQLVTLGDDSSVKFWRVQHRESQEHQCLLAGKINQTSRDTGSLRKSSSVPNKSSSTAGSQPHQQMFPLRSSYSWPAVSPVKKCHGVKSVSTNLCTNGRSSSQENGETNRNKMSTIMDFLKKHGKCNMVPQSPSKGPRVLVVKNQKTPQKTPPASSSVECMCKNSGTCSCGGVNPKKRKRQSGSCTPAKKQCRSENEENRLSPSKKAVSPAKTGTEPAVFQPVTPQSQMKRVLFGEKSSPLPGDEATPRKSRINHVQSPVITPKRGLHTDHCQSPTSNLPNYVMDPIQRTPVARQNSDSKKSVDWLTRMRQKKDGKMTSPQTVKSPASLKRCSSASKKSRPNTEGQTPLKRGSSVNSPQTPSSARKSISRYFSPSTAKS